MTENTGSQALQGHIPVEQALIIERFRKLKMIGLANELEDQFRNYNIFGSMPFEKRLLKCLDYQDSYAREARFKSLFKSSHLRGKLYLNQISPDESRGLYADDLAILAEAHYLDRAVNFIISGATGTGKTALATAAAISAMEHGRAALFYNTADLCSLLQAKDNGSFATFKERVRKVALFIVDDLGIAKLNDLCAMRLYELIDARYNAGSTIITTQLKPDNIRECFPEGTLRDAIVDRLIRDCDRKIILSGLSWRGNAQEINGVRNNV